MLCSLFCASMLVCASTAFFVDGPSKWARAEVRAALDSGFPNWETPYMHGWLSWTQEPNSNLYLQPIPRNQFCHYIAAIVSKDKNLDTCKLEDLMRPNDYYGSKFTDLHRVAWNYEVDLLNYLDIIDGVTETQFDYAGTITREQAAKILARVVKALRPALWEEGKDYFAGKTLRDQAEISPWAQNYIGFVMEQGLMNGLGDGRFDPQGTFTYEQTIVTAYRLCQKVKVPGMIATDKAAYWLDDYRLHREMEWFENDLTIYYKGYADGISKITIASIRVDGIGTLGAPTTPQEPVKMDAFFEGYLAERHVSAYPMIKGQYYTAQVKLTITMKDGSTKKLTDTFVFCY